MQRYEFKELIDVAALQVLTDDLYAATGIPSAIITMDGEVLTGSGWQRICTHFHRKHPEIERDCIESDIAIRTKLREGDEFVVYECPRGLVDASSPVMIEGEHVANVFAGQLFMTPPDEAKERFFLETAEKYGFEVEDYLGAFREIPILAEERFRFVLRFLAGFARLVATIGLARKRELAALEAVRRNERKYRRLLESTNTVPWELDLSTGAFTYMGPQAEKMFGYPLSYWKDTAAWSRAVHPDDWDWASRFRETQAKEGRDHDFTYRVVAADGRTLWIQDVVTVIQGADGRTELVGFMHDVTAKKQAEIEREALEELLRRAQKMEAIGTLAGGIAHDFNNILTPVMAHVELALHRLPSDTPIRRDLEQILQAADRAADLVQQILAISRRVDKKKTAVALGPMVKEVAKFLRASFPSTIDISWHIDEKSRPVAADPTEVHQLLLNLCTNARDAMMESGGKLSIGVEHTRATKEGDENPDGSECERVKLVVRDTGTGIPREILPRVFDPYFTTKPPGKGSGLGLAVVHGIVTNLGGSIRVESSPGQGTTFEVLLPAVVEQPKRPEHGAHEVLPGTGQHILVVDDERTITEVVEEILRDFGYRVTAFNASDAALEAFRSAPDSFDAVLTDYTMPRITGLKLTEEIRHLRPDIPVLLATGFAEGLDEGIARNHGASGLLLKPYKSHQLAMALHQVLGEKPVGAA